MNNVNVVIQYSPFILIIINGIEFLIFTVIKMTINFTEFMRLNRLSNIFKFGYEGMFVKKPSSPCLDCIKNNGPDGCAIFYKYDGFYLYVDCDFTFLYLFLEVTNLKKFNQTVLYYVPIII